MVDFVKRGYFQGDEWYFYLFKRLTEGLVGKDALPDFSTGEFAFITFNYDRSLEYFLYESLRNSFTEVSEDRIVQTLKKLKILHVYGQIAPLKWQDCNEGVDYRPQISEALLQKTAANIKTIYEQKESPDINEAIKLLSQAEQIFFLGFGFAEENMKVLRLPEVIPPPCMVYGTAFNLLKEEVERVESAIKSGRKKPVGYYGPELIKIESDFDCLMLLRKYLN